MARFFLVLALLMAARAFAGPVTVFELDNGMKVAVYEDHSLPRVATNIWVASGSKDETEGLSGFAHLFEHLMFMGTDAVPTGQFDAMQEKGGASNNAYTMADRTGYQSSGPANMLETLLWLDADRIASLGKAMTQEKLDLQRAVVLNERSQNTENAPYGESELAIQRLMYPPDHGYHIDTIGTREDIEGAVVSDVVRFFNRHYVPNNMTMVVAGDVEPAEVRRLVEKHFAAIPRSADPARKPVPDPSFEGERRAVVYDRVAFPKLSLVWHAPGARMEGDEDVSIAAAILGMGTNSRLYDRLIVRDGIASDVSVSHTPLMLGGTFRVDITARTAAELPRIESIAKEEIAAFAKSGPSREEVSATQTQFLAMNTHGLESLEAVGEAINDMIASGLDPAGFANDVDRYLEPTPRSVRRAMQRVLKGGHLALTVLPFTPEMEQTRATAPAVAPTAPFDPPKPVSFTLSNGIPVHLWSRPEIPAVTMQVLWRGGSILDPAGREGTATMAMSMLGWGTEELDGKSFLDALDTLGASFDANASRTYSSASLSTIKRGWRDALIIAASAIRTPAFSNDDWKTERDTYLQGLEAALDEPEAAASQLVRALHFGAETSAGRRTGGSPESAALVSLDDAKAFYRSVVGSAGATILIAGDLTQEEAQRDLETAFGGKWGATVPTLPDPAGTGPDALRFYIVDRPGASSTVVRFLGPAPAYSSPDRVAVTALNIVFGGSFTSRLNSNLREKNGYSYGAFSSFAIEPDAPFFLITTSVQSDATGPALRETLAEIRRIAAGDITPEEAAKARETLRTNLVRGYEGQGGTLAQATEDWRLGRPFGSDGDDSRAVGSVDEKQLNKLAAEWIKLERGTLLLIGDAAAIKAQIANEGLSLPAPAMIDLAGKVVGGEK